MRISFILLNVNESSRETSSVLYPGICVSLVLLQFTYSYLAVDFGTLLILPNVWRPQVGSISSTQPNLSSLDFLSEKIILQNFYPIPLLPFAPPTLLLPSYPSPPLLPFSSPLTLLLPSYPSPPLLPFSSTSLCILTRNK